LNQPLRIDLSLSQQKERERPEVRENQTDSQESQPEAPPIEAKDDIQAENEEQPTRPEETMYRKRLSRKRLTAEEEFKRLESKMVKDAVSMALERNRKKQ
jgi:hypothetical protein